MTKQQMEETVAERRAYVDQIRASFYPEEAEREKTGRTSFWKSSASLEHQEEGEAGYSSLGIRTIIACLIFAAFVYCHQKQISFHQYKAKDVWKQIEWNPLPLEELQETIKISFKQL